MRGVAGLWREEFGRTVVACTATWMLPYAGTVPSTEAGQARPGRSTASMRMRLAVVIPPSPVRRPAGLNWGGPRQR
ncbi:hypothetical protein [Streptomyces glaucescens]